MSFGSRQSSGYDPGMSLPTGNPGHGAIVEFPVPAQPVGRGTIIDFGTPPLSPVITKLPLIADTVQQSWPDLHQWATYADPPGAQPQPILRSLRLGSEIPDQALRQLDHAFNLSKYNPESSKTPQQQNLLDTHKSKLFEAMAHSDFNRHLQQTDQTDASPVFDYQGTQFPKALGAEVMKAEHASVIDNNRRMRPSEVLALSTKLSDLPKAEPPVEIAKNPDPYAEFGKEAGAIQQLKNTQPAKPDDKIIDGWAHDQQNSAAQHSARLLYVDASGAAGNPNRAAGHVALEIDRKVYNKVPDGLQVLDSKSYIQSVTHRSKEKGPQDVYAYPINLSPKEIEAAKQELSKATGKYDPWHNNCATCTLDALQKATAGSGKQVQQNQKYNFENIPNALTPSSVIDNAKNAGRIYGPVYKYGVPNDRKNWDTGFWGLK